jgi:hypothetical protein
MEVFDPHERSGPDLPRKWGDVGKGGELVTEGGTHKSRGSRSHRIPHVRRAKECTSTVDGPKALLIGRTSIIREVHSGVRGRVLRRELE